MHKLKIFLGYFLTVIIVLLVVAYYVLLHFNHIALPDYNKNINLKGLKGKVEVYRDAYAIPHVYAENEEDLYRVVGYLMAQDRLWQMDLLRRLTLGKLSEIFGNDLLKTDILMRSLQIPQKSKMVMAQCSPQLIKALEAYTNGVNQYIAQSKHRLPIEFVILGYKPEPWEIEHSINFISYMAWDLNGCWNSEIVLHKLVSKLTKAQLTDLIPNNDSVKSTIYNTQDKFSNIDWRSVLMDASSKIEDLGLQVFHGSNNWVVAGSKTVSGKPILANDMHLRFSVPGIWYQIHEIIPGKLNVTGVALPGQPFVISGHNDSIAWGLTNVMNDDIDFYRETINPTDSLKYRFNGEWKNMVVKPESFVVKGRGKININLKFTHRGPVISSLKNVKGEVISMRWMGNEMSNEMRSIYLLNRASNWSGFCDALKTFKAVSQNAAYADIKGNIGMYCCAGIPIRHGSPIAVLPGDTDAYDWQGTVPFEELPHKYNPPEGFAASANNRTIDSSYPYYISYWFDLPYRYNRIREMLSTDKKLSVNDISAVQTDFTSDLSAYYIPALVEIMKTQKNLTPTAKIALTELKNWDNKYIAKSHEAAIFEVFYNRFVENVLKDEMGDTIFKEFLVDKILVRNTIQNIWRNKSSILCDDVNTKDKVETFADMVVKSFDESLEYLEKRCGHHMENWEWGKIHTFTLEHPLGSVKILNLIFRFNRGPYEVGGSFHTIAPYSYQYTQPFKVNSGASQRHIYDISNWDNSLSVTPTGNSGISSSNHFCDQTSLYLSGLYHSDFFSDEAVKKNYKYKAVYSSEK